MRVGILGIYHLGFFGVFLPYLAWKSAKVLSARPLPPKEKYFISQIVTLGVFLVISVLIARREWITLFPAAVPKPFAMILGALLLAALVTLMRPMWRQRVEERSRKVWLFMPRTRRERVLWVVCSVAAGVSEEVTYRGVMFAILWRLTGNPIVAALIAAAVFSISHFLQGWKSMAIIFGFAVAFQSISWLSGSLYVAMVVHAAYDVVAGLFYGGYGEKLGYPIEPIPP